MEQTFIFISAQIEQQNFNVCFSSFSAYNDFDFV